MHISVSKIGEKVRYQMQIVIDVPKIDYEAIMLDKQYDARRLTHYERVIANGTPLPKGHGELIDRNKIEYLKAIHDAKYGHIPWSEATARIKYSAPTIIEADKESEG